MVGTLSLNAAVEYLFADYVAKHGMGTVLTGDDNWITPPDVHTQTPGYYALKYGVLGGQLLHGLLRKHRSSYLYYCNKYKHMMMTTPIESITLTSNRREVHATLIGKINGKIRMNVDNSPAYYFPLLQTHYLDYISALNRKYPNFNYRGVLKSLIHEQKILTARHMNAPKTWMPSFFDGLEAENIVAIAMRKITCRHSFACELFEKETLKYTIKQCTPLAKIKLIMTLLYLTVFHEVFLENKDSIINWTLIDAK